MKKLFSSRYMKLMAIDGLTFPRTYQDDPTTMSRTIGTPQYRESFCNMEKM